MIWLNLSFWKIRVWLQWSKLWVLIKSFHPAAILKSSRFPESRQPCGWAQNPLAGCHAHRCSRQPPALNSQNLSIFQQWGQWQEVWELWFLIRLPFLYLGWELVRGVGSYVLPDFPKTKVNDTHDKNWPPTSPSVQGRKWNISRFPQKQCRDVGVL